MNANNKKKTWDKEIMDMCPILYCQNSKSMMETCMCWGFECGGGWKEPLMKLSSRLEMLNIILYPKYGVRIQADQVKEKFGTLHFYYSVVRDCTGLKKKLSYCLSAFRSFVNRKFPPCIEQVVDIHGHNDKRLEILPNKVAYVKAKHKYKYCSNVKVYEEEGKFYQESEIYVQSKVHYAPTKHKIAYRLSCILTDILSTKFFDSSDTNEIEVVRNFMDNYASQCIREAEDECSKTCEECGTQIGTNWSPVCETQGWITYICSECAEESKSCYFMNGALYEAGKMIKTAEEVNREREELEAKCRNHLDERQKQRDAEDAQYQEELKKAEAEEAGKLFP